MGDNMEDQETKSMDRDKIKLKMLITNFVWIVCTLVAIIVLLLTYKFWGKPEPLESLISIGSGLISIVLSIFAIIYSISESIKTSNKESRVNGMLSDMSRMVSEVKELSSKSLSGISDIKRSSKTLEEMYKNYSTRDVKTPTNQQANEETNQESNKKDNNGDSRVYNELGNVEFNSSFSNNTNNSEQARFIKRGDLYFANLSDYSNHFNATGKRMVLVLQNNMGNKYLNTVTIAPITTSVKKVKLPTHISFEYNNKLLTILLEQTVTIPVNIITNKVGEVDANVLDEVDKGLLIQFEIDSSFK
jgi:mRNA interferase MazF